jgi:hypothetical protein
MRQINTQAELIELAKELKVRPDWHEPDEQRVTARASGTHLDNAMGADPIRNCGEMVVILERIRPDDDEDTQIASINLANLLAWASTLNTTRMKAEHESLRLRSRRYLEAVRIREALDQWEASGDDEFLVNNVLDPWASEVIEKEGAL